MFDRVLNMPLNYLRTLKEKALSNKTPTLMKSLNMDIWVAGTSNQLVIRDSKTGTKFSKY